MDKQKPMKTAPNAGNFTGKPMDVRKIATPSPSPKMYSLKDGGCSNKGK